MRMGTPTPEPRSLRVSMIFAASVGTDDLRARDVAADAAFDKLAFADGSRSECRSAWEHGYKKSTCSCSLYAPDLVDECDAVAVKIVVTFVETLGSSVDHAVESVTATDKNGTLAEYFPQKEEAGMTP